MNTIKVDNIAASMRESVRTFSSLLQDLNKDTAKSLTMFGLVLGDSFHSVRDVARSVLIVEQVDLSVLRKLALEGTRLGKMSMAAPLIMTPDYIKRSLDTFPLELLEIHLHHATVFGEDYFDDLVFEDGDIRLQCERELKTMLIGLRQGLLAAAGREKFVKALQLDVGQAISRTLRGLAWLKGDRKDCPIDKVVESVEKHFDHKLPGIKTAMNLTGEHGWREFETLYADVESLGRVANDL